jgi:hypothetical protein
MGQHATTVCASPLSAVDQEAASLDKAAICLALVAKMHGFRLIRGHGLKAAGAQSGCSSNGWLIGVCFAPTNHKTDAWPAKVRTGDPRPRASRITENLQARCARCGLIVIIAPTGRGVAELQGWHMNDVAKEYEVFFR